MASIIAMNAANQAMQGHHFPHWLLWAMVILNTVGVLFVLYHIWRG